MQIGKPGMRAAARESARFGIYLVVATDIADYFIRDSATLGQLLGELTVDIPSVLISSAVGAAVGSMFASGAGLAAIGSLACGPLLVAFVAGVLVGYGLWQLDEHFHITDRLCDAYDEGLQKLREVWSELGAEADSRYEQLVHSHVMNDLRSNVSTLAHKIGIEGEWISRQVVSLW